MAVPLGEEGSQRTVRHSTGEDLLLGRATLTLEEASWNPASGVGVLTVIDGQGEKVPTARGFRHTGSAQNDGIAAANDARTVGLFGDLAGFKGDCRATHGDFTLLFHISSCSLCLRRLCRSRRQTGYRRSRGQPVDVPTREISPWRAQAQGSLLADAQSLDGGAVALEVLLLHVVEQASALPDEFE